MISVYAFLSFINFFSQQPNGGSYVRTNNKMIHVYQQDQFFFFFYHRSERRKFKNLEFPTLSFCFIALGKIGDQAEPSARILDHGDRRSPSHKGFSGRPLWYQVEVLSQILLHFIFNVRQQINTLWFASYNLIRMKLVKKKNGVEVGVCLCKERFKLHREWRGQEKDRAREKQRAVTMYIYRKIRLM